MCTAIFDNRCGAFFGRTLDLEESLGEEIVICHKEYPIALRHHSGAERRYSVMGVATVRDGFPLFYDGVNEAGVAAAALNFPVSAKYADFKEEKLNLASFELIPYVLGTCGSLAEVRELFENVNITSDGFSTALPPSPLHWIFADKGGAVTVESTAEGLKVYDNPVGVLTNEPKFDFQLIRLADYSNLDALPPKNSLCRDFQPTRYSRGLGGVGLPGDFSSPSRFVRAVFVKDHISSDGAKPIERFFHTMRSVFVPRGCVITDEGREVETVYTSCIDLETLTYHFTTYARSEIRSIPLQNVGGKRLFRFPLNAVK